MTFSSFFLIIRRQLTQKWGRFLLASGGIMIGIWAIALTTSLSLGVSDAIVKAINSQPFAKQISLSKTESNQTSFFQITDAPKFLPIPSTDLEAIKDKYPNIIGISPEASLNAFLHVNKDNNGIKCVEENLKVQSTPLSNTTPGTGQVTTGGAANLAKDCASVTISSDSFTKFYETNKKQWSGSTEQPKRGEFVTCFKCGQTKFGETLGAKEPKDLVGKKITMELQRAPELYEGNKVLDVQNYNAPKTEIRKSNFVELTITAVVDDREASIFAGNTQYLDYSYFEDAFKLANENLDPKNYGTIQNSVFINSYQNLDKTVDQLRDDKYLTISLAQEIINAVNVGFMVLTIALSLLGFIALVASVFGIVNVMTISVLERQKEIGVLKSLGARDGDIFRIFLLESSLLGFIGWLLGILLAVGVGNLISFIFIQVVNSNPEIKNNLASINLNSFMPSFPWWLLLGTLAIALVFTVLSGVFPALNASKQNPVDVLRSE